MLWCKNKLKLKPLKQPDWTEWKLRIGNIINPIKKAKIGIIGKYLDIGDYTLKDVYISINEALKHAGAKNNAEIEIVWRREKKRK